MKKLRIIFVETKTRLKDEFEYSVNFSLILFATIMHDTILYELLNN